MSVYPGIKLSVPNHCHPIISYENLCNFLYRMYVLVEPFWQWLYLLLRHESVILRKWENWKGNCWNIHGKCENQLLLMENILNRKCAKKVMIPDVDLCRRKVVISLMIPAVHAMRIYSYSQTKKNLRKIFPSLTHHEILF